MATVIAIGCNQFRGRLVAWVFWFCSQEHLEVAADQHGSL